MRDYAVISPKFWTGTTGKKIRGAGGDAQRVALYLLTAPTSSMIGIYYLPIPTIAHELAMETQAVELVLRFLATVDFAHYDDDSEYVYVPQMARFQVGKTLTKPEAGKRGGDQRWRSVCDKLRQVPCADLVARFLSNYGEAYDLSSLRVNGAIPSEGLLSNGAIPSNSELHIAPNGPPVPAPDLALREREPEREGPRPASLGDPNGRYYDAWCQRTGGSAPIREIRRALDELRATHRESRIWEHWQRYLAQTEIKSLWVPTFAQKFLAWGDQPPEPEAPPGPHDAQARGLLEHLNSLAGTTYEPKGEGFALLTARLAEGADDYQLAVMLERKWREWGSNAHMREFFRPATLFHRTKCADYLGALTPAERADAAGRRRADVQENRRSGPTPVAGSEPPDADHRAVAERRGESRAHERDAPPRAQPPDGGAVRVRSGPERPDERAAVAPGAATKPGGTGPSTDVAMGDAPATKPGTADGEATETADGDAARSRGVRVDERRVSALVTGMVTRTEVLA